MQNDVAPNRTDTGIMNGPAFTESPPRDYLHIDSNFGLNRLTLSDTSLPLMTSPPPPSSLTSPARIGSRFVVMHQDLVNRHALVLTRLRHTISEVGLLREENDALQSFNRQLKLSLSGANSAASSSSLSHRRRSRHDCYDHGASDREEDESPTSVIEATVARVPLPKSISVRSNGYLKLNESSNSSSRSNVEAGGSKTRTLTRTRTQSTSLSGAV